MPAAANACSYRATLGDVAARRRRNDRGSGDHLYRRSGRARRLGRCDGCWPSSSSRWRDGYSHRQRAHQWRDGLSEQAGRVGRGAAAGARLSPRTRRRRATPRWQPPKRPCGSTRLEIETVQVRDGRDLCPTGFANASAPRGRPRRASTASIWARTAMYRYDEFDAAFVKERTAQFRDQVSGGCAARSTRTSSGRCG